METRLGDDVVLITGASGGIGGACAEQFAGANARIVLHGHQNTDELKQLHDRLPTETLAVTADLTVEPSVERLFREAVDQFGTVNHVVSCAGIWPSGETPIHEMSLERWEQTIAVDQTAVFLVAREHFRVLNRTEPEAASHVIVGSTAGSIGEEHHADYATAKAGVMYGLMRSMKNEMVRLMPEGRVNVVSPGWTKTPMAEPGLSDEETVRTTLQTQSLQNVAEPEDVARAVIFLTSDHLAGHITGEVLSVTGGKEGRLLHDPEDVDPSEF